VLFRLKWMFLKEKLVINYVYRFDEDDEKKKKNLGWCVVNDEDHEEDDGRRRKTMNNTNPNVFLIFFNRRDQNR